MALEHIKRYAEGGSAEGASSSSTGALPSNVATPKHTTFSDDQVRYLANLSPEERQAEFDRTDKINQYYDAALSGHLSSAGRNPSGFFNSGIAPWQIATAAPSQVNAYANAYGTQLQTNASLAKTAVEASKLGRSTYGEHQRLRNLVAGNVNVINPIQERMKAIDGQLNNPDIAPAQKTRLETEKAELGRTLAAYSPNYAQEAKRALPAQTTLNGQIIEASPTGGPGRLVYQADASPSDKRQAAEHENKKPTGGYGAPLPMPGPVYGNKPSATPPPAANDAAPTAGASNTAPPPPKTNFGKAGDATGANTTLNANPATTNANVTAGPKGPIGPSITQQADLIQKTNEGRVVDNQKIATAASNVVGTASELERSSQDVIRLVNDNASANSVLSKLSDPSKHALMAAFLSGDKSVRIDVNADGGAGLSLTGDGNKILYSIALNPAERSAAVTMQKEFADQTYAYANNLKDSRLTNAKLHIIGSAISSLTDSKDAVLVRQHLLNESAKYDKRYAAAKRDFLSDNPAASPADFTRAYPQWAAGGTEDMAYRRKRESILRSLPGGGANGPDKVQERIDLAEKRAALEALNTSPKPAKGAP